MSGPLKPAPGGFRYVYVAIHKFSKWIEYKPLVTTNAKKVDDLIEEIVDCFGLLNSIITDLGSMFIGNDFWDFFEDWCISMKCVLVAHLS
jgi:hypothetical protein